MSQLRLTVRGSDRNQWCFRQELSGQSNQNPYTGVCSSATRAGQLLAYIRATRVAARKERRVGNTKLAYLEMPLSLSLCSING